MAGVLVQAGMEVFGADHEHVGKVKESFASDFLLDRRLQTDCYVPYTAVGEVTANTVILTVPSYEVNQQGWAIPHRLRRQKET
jgi:hypothetical protein